MIVFVYHQHRDAAPKLAYTGDIPTITLTDRELTAAESHNIVRFLRQTAEKENTT